MNDAFTVRPLRCEHCGSELPVMGQFVTFQCPSCLLYWILSPEGLKPVQAYQAEPKREPEGETVYLPFWVIEVDRSDLRNRVTNAISDLHETAKTIAGTSAEVNYLLRRIESAERYFVYVPSFRSVNTYAYLKVGRLMTKRQPAYRVVKSSGVSRSILCALQADEAVSLMDFVFFATLPGSIQQSGDFIERIHLAPMGNPYLIEFPFERTGSFLTSLVADFQISSRLIELPETAEHP